MKIWSLISNYGPCWVNGEEKIFNQNIIPQGIPTWYILDSCAKCHHFSLDTLGMKKKKKTYHGSVQWLSHVLLFATPWTAASQVLLSITNSQNLLKLTSIELVMPCNHLILCHPLLLPSTFPSIKVFSNKSVLHIRWSKYWSFSFSISPSNEYSGMISFRTDWFDLLAVPGTLKSLLQRHSSKWLPVGNSLT